MVSTIDHFLSIIFISYLRQHRLDILIDLRQHCLDSTSETASCSRHSFIQVGITPPLLVGLLPFIQSRPPLSRLLLAEHNLPLLPAASSLALSSLSVVALLAEVTLSQFRSPHPSQVSTSSTLLPWTSLLAATLALLSLPHLILPVLHKVLRLNNLLWLSVFLVKCSHFIYIKGPPCHCL